MRIDGNTATIVADRQPVSCGQIDLDPVSVSGHRLVHRVVEHLGRQMMQCAFVDAADIHARTPPDGFQPLQHLNRGSIIFVGSSGRRSAAAKQVITHAMPIRRSESPTQARCDLGCNRLWIFRRSDTAL